MVEVQTTDVGFLPESHGSIRARLPCHQTISFKNLHERIYANCYLCLFRESQNAGRERGPADLQSAALTTELCTQMLLATASFHHRSTAINQAFISFPWLRRESSRERDLRVIRKVNRVFETAQMNIYIAASLHAGLGTKIMFSVRPLPHSDFTLLIPLYDYHPTPALLAFVPPPWPQVLLSHGRSLNTARKCIYLQFTSTMVSPHSEMGAA